MTQARQNRKTANRTILVSLLAVTAISSCVSVAGWCVQPITQQINGNSNQTAGRDFYNIPVYGASVKQLSEFEKRLNKRFAFIEKKLDNRKWQEIERDPFFRTFAQNKYGKPIELLTASEKASFGQDFSLYLVEVKKAEADYQQVKQGTVSDELKALYPKIDQARNNFNYPEVNRLLLVFEEKHSGLSQDVAQINYLRGQNYELQINYSEAEHYFKIAASIEDQNPLYLDAFAGVLNTSGKYSEAEPIYRHTLAIREKQLGPNHAKVATSLNNLAQLLRNQGKYNEAEPLFRRALSIVEKSYGQRNPDVAATQNNLAGLLVDQGKYAEAEIFYRRSLAFFGKQLSLSHQTVATVCNNLGVLLHHQGKYAN